MTSPQAQEIPALSLQESAIGVADWRDWVGAMSGFQRIPVAAVDAMVSSMAEGELLWNDNGRRRAMNRPNQISAPHSPKELKESVPRYELHAT